MSPRKVVDPSAASPTLRTRTARPSSVASSSKETLDGPTTMNETRLSGSPRTKAIPMDTDPLVSSVSDAGSSQISSKGKGKARAMGTPPTTTTTTTTATGTGAGAGAQAAQSKRVLPARLRRAAGGGQEGVRDLEEMIVDWLDRYGTWISAQS